jgi:hypothetical protein
MAGYTLQIMHKKDELYKLLFSRKTCIGLMHKRTKQGKHIWIPANGKEMWFYITQRP